MPGSSSTTATTCCRIQKSSLQNRYAVERERLRELSSRYRIRIDCYAKSATTSGTHGMNRERRNRLAQPDNFRSFVRLALVECVADSYDRELFQLSGSSECAALRGDGCRTPVRFGSRLRPFSSWDWFWPRSAPSPALHT